ncbi:helix-turn-helix domain-containing protein [Methylomicrobium agile]|uniref:helix-turn-helix domain-containing protein n=1 Tax=Methylomicrobium agile TaxID=39774 RepID=UPI0006906698|nr:helix-turn-helix transcriptional regulator [Methylomicrobium agile]
MNTQELQIKIGKKIKELRLVNGWTQEQTSEKLHVCRNTYSDIELGKTDICLSRLVQLANFYSVDVNYFLDDKERVVFYLTGNQNTQANQNIEKQCNEYHRSPEDEKLRDKLEEMQAKLDEVKAVENQLLKEQISQLKEQISQLKQINSLSSALDKSTNAG